MEGLKIKCMWNSVKNLEQGKLSRITNRKYQKHKQEQEARWSMKWDQKKLQGSRLSLKLGTDTWKSSMETIFLLSRKIGNMFDVVKATWHQSTSYLTINTRGISIQIRNKTVMLINDTVVWHYSVNCRDWNMTIKSRCITAGKKVTNSHYLQMIWFIF